MRPSSTLSVHANDLVLVIFIHSMRTPELGSKRLILDLYIVPN